MSSHPSQDPTHQITTRQTFIMQTNCIQPSLFKHRQPTEAFTPFKDGIKIFLAGSINMGCAPKWQSKLVEALADLTITVNNPRCDDFNSQLEQHISCPELEYQVMWEMKHLEKSDIIAIYFDPNPIKLSPITLLTSPLACRTSLCPKGTSV
jgi:hypothetical protein